jgi:hypothetical protein
VLGCTTCGKMLIWHAQGQTWILKKNIDNTILISYTICQIFQNGENNLKYWISTTNNWTRIYCHFALHIVKILYIYFSKDLIQSYEICAFLLSQQYNYTEDAVHYSSYLCVQFICILKFHVLSMLFSHWLSVIYLRTIKLWASLCKSNENGVEHK